MNIDSTEFRNTLRDSINLIGYGPKNEYVTFTAENKLICISRETINGSNYLICSVNETAVSKMMIYYDEHDIYEDFLEAITKHCANNTEAETPKQLDTAKIRKLMYLRKDIDSAIDEFISEQLLRGKDVSRDEIKDRIAYRLDESLASF